MTRGRLARRLLATLAVTGMTSVALLVQAPVAGASTMLAAPAPNVGLLPFPGDVSTIGSNRSLIAVDPNATPPSAPLFNAGGYPLNLT